MTLATALLAVLVLMVPGTALAQSTVGAGEKIGQVNFPVSCSAAVQKPFERAVALLHSFWYLESHKAFVAISQTDPDCAMAYFTPGPIVTARELLGDMLLEAKQPAAAAREYEASLKRAPNRFKALHGAGKAAAVAGQRERARGFYTTLVSVAAPAGTERAELQDAKAFLGR